MHIIGTAGHVDHGKSSLVRALTGTDPDRWIEEKLRGVTLDLGFAQLRFEDGIEAGIVDVPGHQRFLHNMLAGAAGMELLVLAVAANEGPRPQTIEHLAILSYLNVRKAIVVLTKADLVDAEGLARAEQLVRDAVRGTVADGAEVLAVSTVTNEGVDALRTSIHRSLRGMEPRASEAPAYLPVDRVFVLPGHGTIVTGTLMQGSVSVGDSLRLSPLGRDVRTRSLQVFGENRKAVSGGSRVAVSLPGVATDEIGRGAVLASPQLSSHRSFRVMFSPYAPALLMCRRRNLVRAHIGSAEILGVLQFEHAPPTVGPVSAQLHLREPTIGLPGGTFVVRRLSPKDLLGGGTFEGLGRGAEGTGEQDAIIARLSAALHQSGLEGAAPAALGAAANVREEIAVEVLEELQANGSAYRLARPDAFVSAEVVSDVESRILTSLQRNETTAHWMMGMTSLALSRDLGIPEPAVLRILALLAEDGKIAARGGYYATAAFTPRLSVEHREFFGRELRIDAAQPFLPVSLSAVIASIRAARITGLSQAFDTLVASGAAVKVGENVYRGNQIAEVRRLLEEKLRKERQITASGFRDIVGTSRKYAVPLLEWFDATGVTIRSGDFRTLRERRPGGGG